MAAKIISGTETAAIIREELKEEVKILKEQHGLVPGLVTIIVGVNPASVSYVTAKQKTAKELGFYSIQEDCMRMFLKRNSSPWLKNIIKIVHPRYPCSTSLAETHQ